MRRKVPLVRLKRRGVAPVVGTIMMVAVTVVLAVVVFVLVSGMLSPPPPTPVSITFSNTPWVGGRHSAMIESATGVSAFASSAVTYQVLSPEGDQYFVGAGNATQTVGGIDVTVTYVDNDGNDRITAGDSVVIQVEPEASAAAVEGGVIKLFFDGRQLASHSL